MSACHDCPKYGIGKNRRAMCCEEMKARDPSLQDTVRRLQQMLDEEQFAAKQQEPTDPMNRAARRRAAKLARSKVYAHA